MRNSIEDIYTKPQVTALNSGVAAAFFSSVNLPDEVGIFVLN